MEKLQAMIKNSFDLQRVGTRLVDELYTIIEEKVLNDKYQLMSLKNIDKLLEDINSVCSKHFGVIEPKIDMYTDYSLNVSAMYHEEINEIVINSKDYTGDFLGMIFSYLHEFGHHLQYEAVKGRFLQHNFTDEQLYNLARNMITSDYHAFSNYIGSYDMAVQPFYLSQPLEKNANEFAISILYEVVSKFHKEKGNHSMIDKFIKGLAGDTAFIPTKEEYKKYEEDVFRIWDFKEKQVQLLDDKYDNLANLGSFSPEEIETYFETYTWRYLGTMERRVILQQYDRKLAEAEGRKPFLTNDYLKNVDKQLLNSIPSQTLEIYYQLRFDEWSKYLLNNPEYNDPMLVQSILHYYDIKDSGDRELIKASKGNLLKEKYMYNSLLAVKDKVLTPVDKEDYLELKFANQRMKDEFAIDALLSRYNYKETTKKYHSYLENKFER